MLYDTQDYFLWSLLYSLNNKFDRIINLNFLYSLFKDSLNKELNIFHLKNSELLLLLNTHLNKTKLQDKKKKEILKIFANDLNQLKIQVKKELELCEENGIKYITYEQTEYFTKLKALKNPPFIIFYKGFLPTEQELVNSLAIIGSRDSVPYSEAIAEKSGKLLSEHKIWNISGLALGCDTSGHKGSLLGGGKTGAVLAAGLSSNIYPAKNRPLAEEILYNKGFLMSELCPSIPLIKVFLIDRDRLQSALTDGIFVIQCGLKSGTLHAKFFTSHIYINSIKNKFYKLDNLKLNKISSYEIISISNGNALLNKIAKKIEKHIPSFESIPLKF